METLFSRIEAAVSNLWPLFLTMAVILYVAGFIRRRQAAGRDPIGIVLDGLTWVLGTAGLTFLIINVIVSTTMPNIEAGIHSACGKSRANKALCDVYDGNIVPSAAGQQVDPWASPSAAPTGQQQPPAPAAVQQQQPAYPDIPVFVTITFGDGIKRDVCGVRADASGTYNIALLCDEKDKVTNNTMSLTGADLSPLADKLPAAPTPVPTTPPAAVQQQPAVAPLIFEENQAAAQCFWAELLRRKSELERFGTQLLPAGSTWVLVSKNSAFWRSLKNEQYDLCSVKWGYCLKVDGVTAEKLNRRSADPFYGEGSFPFQCVPTTNP